MPLSTVTPKGRAPGGMVGKRSSRAGPCPSSSSRRKGFTSRAGNRRSSATRYWASVSLKYSFTVVRGTNASCQAGCRCRPHHAAAMTPISSSRTTPRRQSPAKLVSSYPSAGTSRSALKLLRLGDRLRNSPQRGGRRHHHGVGRYIPLLQESSRYLLQLAFPLGDAARRPSARIGKEAQDALGDAGRRPPLEFRIPEQLLLGGIVDERDLHQHRRHFRMQEHVKRPLAHAAVGQADSCQHLSLHRLA